MAVMIRNARHGVTSHVGRTSPQIEQRARGRYCPPTVSCQQKTMILCWVARMADESILQTGSASDATVTRTCLNLGEELATFRAVEIAHMHIAQI